MLPDSPALFGFFTVGGEPVRTAHGDRNRRPRDSRLPLPGTTQMLRLLAERIKSLRRAKGWSQEQLAERAAMQRSYLADLERGQRNPSVRTLVKVANALGVSISGL